MLAKTLMIQGSMSSAGKSLLVTALCRLYADRGLKVAPFKAQNMSNNAAVCPDGGEIGRAQYTQAQAARIRPTVQMNPILLKPEADSRSQVVVNGAAWETLPARNYYERKQFLWEHVAAAVDELRREYELVIIEGAGSPVELNLKRGDIVNMAVAKYAQSPVLLAGDIDRGGIFAQLLGTYWLLEPDEQMLLKGFLINKFRGDISLFADGVEMIQDRSGVPVMGVLPYVKALNIPEEDAVAVENASAHHNPGEVDIAVIRLPRIANFDDFDPLAQQPGVTLRYVHSLEHLGKPDAIIIPGTKSTMADLRWLREAGFVSALKSSAAAGKAIVGICGGYQMLGDIIHDPDRVESDEVVMPGLGLLPIETTFAGDKATFQSEAKLLADVNWLYEISGQSISGYEIHMGRTTGSTPWLTITEQNGQAVQQPDGSISDDGCIWGCYLHGLFANTNLRTAWLRSLGWTGDAQSAVDIHAAIDHLTAELKPHFDWEKLDAIIGL